jgi:hypothetical protein
VTSDAAKAIIAHAETYLGAHHSPDLFHVQYDTVRATSAALASQTAAAVRELEKSQQKIEDLRSECRACREQCPQDPLAEVLEQHIARKESEQAAAAQRVQTCRSRQERAQAARQGLGYDYHPVDLETGQPLTAEEVGRRLAGHFDTLDQVAAEAGLSAHARDKLAKARRVLDSMQATIAFFWAMIATRLAAWQLGDSVQQWLRQGVDPGLLPGAGRGEGGYRRRTPTTADLGCGGPGAGTFSRWSLGHVHP